MCAPVGLNKRTLGARLMGEKHIFLENLMCFMFEIADLGLYYVVAGDHWDDVGPLARAGLVIAEGGHDY
jgi:hypothetical protein